MSDLAVESRRGRLQGLEALREVLVSSIAADKSGHQTAALARQLREVLREVDELVKRQGRKGSLVDELSDRRKVRGTDASGVAGSGRGRKNVGS